LEVTDQTVATGAVGNSTSPLNPTKAHSIFELSFKASPGSFGVQLHDPGPRFGCEIVEEEPAKFVGSAQSGGGSSLSTADDARWRNEKDALPPVPCSQECADEFAVCADHGPGYSICVEEIQRKEFRLGSVCRRDCELTTAMLAHEHSMCRHSCEHEFNLCVIEGPGYAECLKEVTNPPVYSPLRRKCDNGCTPTTVMLSYDDQQKPTCSAACRTEFQACVSRGGGLTECVHELRQQIGPLASVCEVGCKITAEMMSATAPSPPPFPPTHTCTKRCEDEFGVCVQHNPGGCNACNEELNKLPPSSPLLAKGCSHGCVSTAHMRQLCSRWCTPPLSQWWCPRE